MHYQRLRRTGTLERVEKTHDERFWEKVVKGEGDECWIWTGAHIPEGYGQAWDGTSMVMAHRYAYLLHHGEIDPDLTIDHMCHDPAVCKPAKSAECPHRSCVRWNHLEQKTRGENALRSEGVTAHNRDKTFCKNGHPFDEANTYRYRTYRYCKTCMRENSRIYEKSHARIRFSNRHKKDA